jgi:predicted amino acid-binding ACT domain protein
VHHHLGGARHDRYPRYCRAHLRGRGAHRHERGHDLTGLVGAKHLFRRACASGAAVLRALEDEFRQELARRDIDSITSSAETAVVTVVGAGMRHTPGLAGRIFTALGQAGVNVIAIAQGSSECSISLVVLASEADEAVRAVHGLIVGEA